MKLQKLRNSVATAICNNGYEFIDFVSDIKKEFSKDFHQLSKSDWYKYINDNGISINSQRSSHNA